MELTKSTQSKYTAFVDRHIVAAGSLGEVSARIRQTLDERHLARLLIFDDRTGSQVDLDPRDEPEEPVYESAEPSENAASEEQDAKPTAKVGRPKLGVVSGEVTLLPRHWDWLKSQPGGASVTLRKLVEEARRAGEEQAKKREAQEAAYRFMTAIAGDFDGYEEALRELYAGNRERFERCIANWGTDVARYASLLAAEAFAKSDQRGEKTHEADRR